MSVLEEEEEEGRLAIPLSEGRGGVARDKPEKQKKKKKKREQNKQQATLGGKQASESSLLPESRSQEERQGAQRESFC